MAKGLSLDRILDGLSRRQVWGPSVAVSELRRAWEENKKLGPTFEQFIPVRLTSCLETATQHALHTLIESGGDYLTRGLNLLKKRSLQDIAEVMVAIQSDKLTIAGLISQTQTVNSIEELISAMTDVYGEKFKEDLAKVEDQVAIEIDKHPARPIIDDLDKSIATLRGMVLLRHIIVHEAPIVSPFESQNIKLYLDATEKFVLALEWLVVYKLKGKIALTQVDINKEAGDELEAAEGTLKTTFALAMTKESNKGELQRSQELWEKFSDHQSKLRAGYLSDDFSGTIAPTIYAGEKEALVREREKDLRKYYSRAH